MYEIPEITKFGWVLLGALWVVLVQLLWVSVRDVKQDIFEREAEDND